MKTTVRLFIVAALATSLANAQSAPPAKRGFGKVFWALGAAALFAGTAMDVHSSYGQIELNPALRSTDGRFGARGAGIRFGIVGGSVLTQWLIIRKHPHAAVPLGGVNIAVGAVLGGISVRNRRVIREADLLQ